MSTFCVKGLVCEGNTTIQDGSPGWQTCNNVSKWISGSTCVPYALVTATSSSELIPILHLYLRDIRVLGICQYSQTNAWDIRIY